MMTKGSAFLLALGLAAAALLNSGIWEYGDGFIFNRFNGDIIYVDLPDDADLTHVSGLARDEDTGRGDVLPAVHIPSNPRRHVRWPRGVPRQH